MKRKQDEPQGMTYSAPRPQYEVNWEAVKTVEDLKGIMQTFGIVFTCPPANVDHIMHLVTKI